MPIDVLTTPDNFRVQGSMTVINDPNGNNGNVNIAGNVTASGTASFGTLNTSTMTVSSGLTVSGGATLNGGTVINNNLYYDYLVGGPPTTSTNAQLVSGTSSTITMTGNGRVLFLNVSSTNSTCILTPTGSASATSTSFTNGMQVTLVNLNPAPSSTVTIPSGSTGALGAANINISGGAGLTLMWMQALGSWVRV